MSPFAGRNCRFHPTCSNYAIEAIKEHGALVGLYYFAKRLVRCQPFSEGGLDPVPKKGQN